MNRTIPPASQPVTEHPPEALAEYEYIDRLQANLRIAEQTLGVVQEMDAAAPIERTRRTSLAVSVVIPVYNERDTVVEIVRRVQAVGIHQEIIIVDDYSVDGTRQLLVELAREPDIRVLMHGYNRGKGAALRTGFEQARGEVIAVQDADLEYDPNDLARLLEPIECGEADVVYGSRFLNNAEQDPSKFHRLGNRLLTAASNFTTGQRLTDMETCYKIFRREALSAVEIEENRFGFEPEITAKLSRLGFKIHELPISYSYRSYEEGKKIGWRDAARALWCIGKYGLIAK
jgi:glycosyltransferase involved in cell wall biosynthesis